MNFHNYIKAVGTGPKGNRDLSFEESQDMMTQLLEQNIHSEQIAAFLLGWRMKPETVEEFKGALSAMDSFTKFQKVENSFEMGYPFDGKLKHPYLFPLVAKILKERVSLIFTGDVHQPVKKGISVQDICQNMTHHENFHYFDRKEYLNELHTLSQTRNKLGLRTGLNSIEKLPHVSKSDYAITGVFHKPYVQKYIEIFAPRYKQFALIQGDEGTPELFKKGHLWVHNNSEVKEYIIDPEHYGISYQKSYDSITLKESLDLVNNPSESLVKLAILNAAVILFVAQQSSSIDEAYEMLT